MKKYKKGEKPLIGDIVEHIEEDDDYDYINEVTSINENGTINVSNGLGVLHDLEPSNYFLLSRRADAIEMDCQILLNGMSYKEFNIKFSKFLKENDLKII